MEGPIFLILMVVGLAGLFVMALPAFGRHGAIRAAHASKIAHLHGAGTVVKAAGARAGAAAHAGRALVEPAGPKHAPGTEGVGLTRFLPSPRLVFSLFALYGAFGNALVRAVGMAPLWAALAAVVPAIIVEKLAVTPLWNFLFRFQGQPSSLLEALVLCEARAVTPFRNGRGIVSVARDGRLVQFSARLVEAQASERVHVGDALRVEDIDAEHERLTVSVPRG